jgi:hypothetical protein
MYLEPIHVYNLGLKAFKFGEKNAKIEIASLEV